MALVLWGGLACFLLCALGLWALIKLPGPVPYRWEVRLFLLMGMPADQFLAFIIKVLAWGYVCMWVYKGVVWVGGCVRVHARVARGGLTTVCIV